MKSVSQTTGHNHGKRVKIVMRVKLYSQSECSPRWRLFLFVFHVLHRKVSPEHRSGAASPYLTPRPPATLPHSSSGNPTDRYDRGDRRTGGCLPRSFCGLHVLRKLRTVYVFCCNTKSCPSLPCFPPPARNSPSCVTRQEKHPPMSFRSVSRTTARINYLRGWNQTHLFDSGQPYAVL